MCQQEPRLGESLAKSGRPGALTLFIKNNASAEKVGVRRLIAFIRFCDLSRAGVDVSLQEHMVEDLARECECSTESHQATRYPAIYFWQ